MNATRRVYLRARSVLAKGLHDKLNVGTAMLRASDVIKNSDLSLHAKNWVYMAIMFYPRKGI